MAVRSTAEEIERLQLSDSDTEELWNSPSKRRSKKSSQKTPDESRATPEPRQSHEGETLFDREETREAALRNELQSVRNISNVIEGLLDSLDHAKGNMQTVSRTVDSASTLLNTWTRILSQTEHNQRLILNPNWQGASQDAADIENEAILKQQAAERRERELQQQREAASRKTEEVGKRRPQPTNPTARTRIGATRGRVRGTGLGRTPSISQTSVNPNASRTAATRGTTSATSTTTRRPISGRGVTRGTGIARGRDRT